MDDKLSLISLILDASLLVQLVMSVLTLASLVSWYMIIRKHLFFNYSKNESVLFEDDFYSGKELQVVYNEGSQRLADNIKLSPLERVFRYGFEEFQRMSRKTGDKEKVLSASIRAMRIGIAREQEVVEQHLPFLATVASVSPYVGLFGTVWGIMNSFRGLANANQATLAIVAPGVSEALIATAMGLFAAIPAVIAFNRFNSVAENLMNQCDTFADEMASILDSNINS